MVWGRNWASWRGGAAARAGLASRATLGTERWKPSSWPQEPCLWPVGCEETKGGAACRASRVPGCHC